MNIDPAWLEARIAEDGALSGWMRDGLRWVRRWVVLPAERYTEIANAKVGEVAYVVERAEDGWSFDSIMDADGPAATAEGVMGWCDRKGCSAVLLATEEKA